MNVPLSFYSLPSYSAWLTYVVLLSILSHYNTNNQVTPIIYRYILSNSKKLTPGIYRAILLCALEQAAHMGLRLACVVVTQRKSYKDTNSPVTAVSVILFLISVYQTLHYVFVLRFISRKMSYRNNLILDVRESYLPTWPQRDQMTEVFERAYLR